ncbi:26S proteasome non-ATPase regulatory subunit 2 homolog A-like [Olea europaea subsp. europaea]|nr:26S proteasome non-ATPase regulatory subunit 2 homolog A-like [Olea europaea subsp. europaea]
MIGPLEASSVGSTTSWVLENKEHGQASATASLGMILLWDVDYGLAQIDEYIHSTNTHIIAGALLGVGILNCRVNKNCYLLADYVHNKESSIRIGAIMGLGIAYAGSQDKEISIILNSILEDSKESLDVIAFSAVSLGLVYLGSCSEYFAETISLTLKKRNASDLGEPLFCLLPLGLGLLYLGKQDNVNARATTLLETFNEKIGKYCYMTLISCAYAGTGDALKVQKFLHACEHLKNGEKYQGPAVLGIAMVAMAEELGLEMAIRSLEHLLQYGNHNIRTAVPLALGLLCISNPKVKVIDTLRRLSQDRDREVAMTAIIALGLIGAGTNNAKIAGCLRNLSTFYDTFPSLLFCVRIAQGLVHLGKGLLTLSPYHSERFLLSPTALAGLVILLHACLDLRDTILWMYPYVLYFIVLAIQPRMLMTVDQDLKPVSVPVRVGQAVGVVGRAGCPKTITGFRTLPTPVILSAGERAELATERYVPLSPILEGFVILKENPDYRDDQ